MDENSDHEKDEFVEVKKKVKSRQELWKKTTEKREKERIVGCLIFTVLGSLFLVFYRISYVGKNSLVEESIENTFPEYYFSDPEMDEFIEGRKKTEYSERDKNEELFFDDDFEESEKSDLGLDDEDWGDIGGDEESKLVVDMWKMLDEFGVPQRDRNIVIQSGKKRFRRGETPDEVLDNLEIHLKNKYYSKNIIR